MTLEGVLTIIGGPGGENGVCGGRRLAAGLATWCAVLSGLVLTPSLAAAAVGVSGGQLPATTATPARTLLASPPRAVKNFSLTTEEGSSLSLSQLSGAPILMFFGFAHCPTICPAALTQLRMLEVNHASDLGATRIVVISVDGERDTPAMLHDWLKPISPTFIGLTGPTNVVHDIAAQFTAAFFKGTPQGTGDYLVEHSSQIFLLDSQGRLRATFFDAPIETVARITRDVAIQGSQPPGD